MRTTKISITLIALAIILAPAVALAQGNAKEIMAKPAAELIEILKNPNSTTFEKAKACQRLAIVGTKDAIPALAALLPDEKLNVYARTALENIPGPEVDVALREAAKTLKGRSLVGVIDSIGQRRDAKAAELLATYLEDKDPAVASAAVGAIGRIGVRDATQGVWEAIHNDTPIKMAAADALLNWIELFAANVEKQAEKENDWRQMEEVVYLYAVVAGVNLDYLHDHPKYIKVAGLRGMFSIMPKCKRVSYLGTAVRELLIQVRSPDVEYFNVGLEIARWFPGVKMTDALVGELEKLPAERRALLLQAIADRKDRPPLDVIVRESKIESEAVRKAAVYALTQRADADAANVLIDIALGEGAVAVAAKDGLIKIPGKGIDATIIEKYASANGHTKAVLLDLFGDRGRTTALPTVRKALDDSEQPVRLAALNAAAKLIDVADLDLLIGRMLASDKPKEETTAARSALDIAVLRMGDRDATAARLAAHIDSAKAEQQSLLFDLLRKVSGKKALEEVVARTKSKDSAQKNYATRVLGQWVNADAGPALLDIAKNDSEKKYQIRALRGYIRIARQLQIPWWKKSDAPAVKLKMYDEAMAVAQRVNEKLLALDILTRIPSAETLNRAVACLDDPALKEKAASTAVSIAGKEIGRNPKAVAKAMRKVIDAKPEAKTADTARQLLERAGG